MTLVAKQPLPIAGLFWLALLCFVTACSKPEQPSFSFSGDTMGTRYHITVVADYSPSQQQRLQQLVDRQLREVNRQMSTYIADSELSRFNHQTPVGESFAISEPLFEVLALGLEISWLSNGAFDFTVGELVDLWGFGPTPGRWQAPPEQAREKALQGVGYQHISLDLAATAVSKDASVSVDLSAIAKGYGVDLLADSLLAAGLSHFMVEIGGEIRVHGKNPRQQLWQIAIEQPGSGRDINRVIGVTDKAMATSGDYRNYFEQDGKRYSHTIDPRTGFPVEHNLASVTVLADTAAFADGMATAMLVMGPEAALTLAEQQQLAVYLLVKTEQGFVSQYSDGFSRYLQ